MIIAGIESIHKQTDTSFIYEIHKEINELQDIIRITLKDDIDSSGMNYDDLDKYKRTIKQSMLTKHLDNIGTILTHRFGFKLTINNLLMKDMKLSSLTIPTLNYKTTNLALSCIEDLFPKKRSNEVLWETMASSSEKAIYKTLNAVKESIRQDKFKLDFKHATVSGLDNEEFIINLDIIKSLILNITPEELTALLITEVGRIYAYLEYLSSTTNSSFTLLDTFINEKFNKNNTPIAALSISMNKTDRNFKSDKTSIAILEDLNMFMLKTYRIDEFKGSITIDYQRSADVFAIRFGVADLLSKTLAKQASDGFIDISNDSYDSVAGSVIDTITTIIGIIVFVIMFLISLVIGFFAFIALAAYVTIKLILKFILKTIFNIFSSIFVDNSYKDKHFDSLFKRLDKVKLELVREMRRVEVNKDEQKILIKQIDEVNEVIKKLKLNIGNLNKYGYVTNDNRDDISLDDIIETLEENDLHLLGAKFNNLN